MSFIFEPGFFSSAQVHMALATGAIVAVVSGVVGVPIVTRGQSFAGHSLSEIAAAGGSGAFLAGLSTVVGFAAGAVLGAGAMEAIGARQGRARARDLATGIVLSAASGLAALFLYLVSTEQNAPGTSQVVLFGSIFGTTGTTLALVACLGVASLSLTAVVLRPLLLMSLSPDVAVARGVRVRLVGMVSMLSLALAVGLASVALGAILSTALLIGPAATALRVTRSPGTAMLVSALAGAFAVCLGVTLAYDSYYWSSSHAAWPASFFVVAVVFVSYVAAGVAGRALRLRGRDRDRLGGLDRGPDRGPDLGPLRGPGGA